MRIIRMLGFVAFAASSFAQIQQPQLGMMLAADSSARPVYGVTGSVTLGPPGATGILSIGCARLLCLMKTDSAIVSPSGSTAAPKGPAWFSFQGGTALVYFPEARRLARWRNNQLADVDFELPGEILAVRENAAGITAAVRNSAGVWIVGPGNTILESLSGAAGPVILLDNGVLFSTPGALILRRPGANDLSFPVEGVASLAWLGEHYVQAGTRQSSYALRIDSGAERLFLLPEPAP